MGKGQKWGSEGVVRVGDYYCDTYIPLTDPPSLFSLHAPPFVSVPPVS